ncbi:MAG: zinc ribbon domain-containing protein [Candidatus Paceibacterota bacterium]
MKNNNCESCMMPLSKDPGQSGSDQYCSYCFKDGKFTYEGNDVNEFKKGSYEEMRKKGTNPILAKFYTWMIGFAPRWKK